MSKLRNWRWEKFAQEVAAGGDAREAYTLAVVRRWLVASSS
jgi:hypothetical protein